MASYVSALSLDLYIYVTHVYFWGNFNRLFRYWFARVCDGLARGLRPVLLDDDNDVQFFFRALPIYL